MPISRIGIWTRISHEQAISRALRLAARPLQEADGFTLIEMILVLLLIGTLFVLILPRIGSAESVWSAGRRLVSMIRTLEASALATQKTLKLYLDLDQRLYWVMVVEGNEERPPTEAALASRVPLPWQVRFLDVTTLGQGKRESGRAYLQVSPAGRADPCVIHLADQGNNLLALQIAPVTGQIRISEQRLDMQRPEPMPERLRPLLQPFSSLTAWPFPTASLWTVSRAASA